MKQKTERVIITIDTELRKKVDDDAKKYHRTRSGQITYTLEQHYSKSKTKSKEKELEY